MSAPTATLGQGVRRFWVPAGGQYELDAEGYLADPEAVVLGQRWHNTEALSSEDLRFHRSVVLLGEPGSGKTTFLRNEGPLLPPDVVTGIIKVNLASYSSEERLARSVLEGPEISEWWHGTGELCLVLDGFDEAQTRIPSLASLFVDFLEAWPLNRLWLRLACRTADWPSTLDNFIATRAPDALTVELLPLRQSDVHTSASSVTDPAAFLEEVARIGAQVLASRPLTLRLLMDAYRSAGELPQRPSALYETGLLAMCDEWNRTRRDAGATASLSPRELYVTARAMAAATTFGGASAFWTGPGPRLDTTSARGDVVEATLTPDSLASMVEHLDDRVIAVTGPGILEVLRTSLFSGSGPNRMGWTHATFADYLAAAWLQSQNLTKSQVASLLLSGDGQVFPQVRRCASWAMAIDPGAFGWIARADPEAFVGEVDIPDESLREEVIDGLFRLAESGRLIERMGVNYARLCHAAIASQVATHIGAGSFSVRRLAIELSDDCRLSEAYDSLCGIALNPDEPEGLRVASAWALHRGDVAGDRLLPLLNDPHVRGPDERFELRGIAILASWPNNLSTADALSNLSELGPRNFHGSFRLAVSRIAERLSVEDVPALAAWLGNPAADDELLEPLHDAAIRLCANQLEESETKAAVVEACRRRMADYKTVLSNDSLGLGSLGDETRRKLALAVAEGASENVLVSLAYDHSSGLLGPQDLSWLVEKYESATDRAAQLEGLIRGVLRPGDPEHSEIVLGVPAEHPLAAGVFRPWLETIDLTSREALQAREQWQQVVKLRPKGAEPRPDEVDSWIRKDLAEFSSSEDLSAFAHALHLMTVRPGTERHFDEFQPDVTKHRRWIGLPDDLRAQLIVSAKTYLSLGKARPELWLGEDRIYEPARAGYRCLVLLLREDPEELLHLTPQTWREWSSILVGWTSAINGASVEDKTRLLDLALPHAAEKLRSSLLQVIDLAARQGRLPFVRAECDQLWDPHLAAELAHRLRTGLPSTTCHEIAETLARNDPVAAEAVLSEWVSDAGIEADEERAALAATLLLRHAARSTWPILRRLLEERPRFFERVLLRAGPQYDRTIPDLAPNDIADLYLWMRRAFPAEEDPQFEDVHAVGPREAVGHWRDGFVDALCAAGTPAAAAAVRRIADTLPGDLWLERMYAIACRAVRGAQWQPVSPSELARIAEDTSRRLVRTPEELLDLVHEALGTIQARLLGETPESHLLWDTRTMRPKSEDEASDYLHNRLKDLLQYRGLVVNREVQVRRESPSGIGERTDIRVDATAIQSPSTGASPVMSLVLEVKGAWNSDLLVSLHDQLVNRYMRDIGTLKGIYVVLWPDVGSWSKEGGGAERQRLNRLVKADVEAQLGGQAAVERERGHDVRVVHLGLAYRRG